MAITSNKDFLDKVQEIIINSNINIDKFNIETFNSLTKSFLDSFNTDYQDIDSIYQECFNGTTSFINNELKNLWISNFLLIEVENLYLGLIINEVANNNLVFNYKQYGEIITLLFKNKKHIQDNYSDIYPVVKKYLKFIYGALPNSDILNFNIKMSTIIDNFKKVISDFYNINKKHIIYIEADRFFVLKNTKVKYELIQIFNSFNLNYDIDENNSGIVFDKKRFILKNTKGLITKGIKTLEQSNYFK